MPFWSSGAAAEVKPLEVARARPKRSEPTLDKPAQSNHELFRQSAVALFKTLLGKWS